MKYFLDTIETIPENVGFQYFGPLHFCWIVLCVLIVCLNCIWYCRMSGVQKARWRHTIAILIAADELFKVIMLVIGGRYNPTYLPLHLCSINIFLIAIHAWKPTDLLSGFLYTVCIPGAIAAILFPSWSSLPLWNFMHLHSFTVHILLVLYPVVMVVSGDWKPHIRKMPLYVLMLLVMSLPIILINFLLDTNFMFLMEAEDGNPLKLFETLWGSHLWGFPVLISAVLFVMYVPVELYRYLCKRKDNRRK